MCNRQLNDSESPFTDFCADAAQRPAMIANSAGEHRTFRTLRGPCFFVLAADACVTGRVSKERTFLPVSELALSPKARDVLLRCTNGAFMLAELALDRISEVLPA